MRRLDDRGPEHRAHDEARARVGDAERRLRIHDRSGAKHEAFRQRGRHLPDVLDGAGDGHRDLERAHAAFGERVDDARQRRAVLQPDDGDDARRFEALSDFVTRHDSSLRAVLKWTSQSKAKSLSLPAEPAQA